MSGWRNTRALLLSLLILTLLVPATADGAVIPHATAVKKFAPRPVDPTYAVAYPVQSMDGLAVARDGTGGLAYTASVNGVEHVFVMRLQGGLLSPPVEVDATLGGVSSQPVLAAAPQGELVVAFVNGGNLYTSEAANADHQLSAPTLLASGASNPSISLNLLGQGYLAFTQRVGAGSDVEAYFWAGTHWHLAQPEPFNVVPQDNAGTGIGRPVVVAAHDGVGLVAWGENGHVYSRRVWNTMTSIETEQLDQTSYTETSSNGSSATNWTWQQAGAPAVATDGNSTYMDVAFTETMTDGATSTSRVFVARLVGQTLHSVTAVDGLTTLSSNGGLAPQIVMNENGTGLVTDTAVSGASVIATPLGYFGRVLQPLEIGPADAVGPAVVPAAEGGTRTMAAWVEPYQNDPGNPQVVAWYLSDPHGSATPTAISSPTDGPVDVSAGLLAGGDGTGDGLIAWLQGTAGSETIHLGGMLAPPGIPAARRVRAVTTRVRPTLRWRRAKEHFGAVTYSVTLAGRVVATTDKLSVKLPSKLSKGRYHWHVTATNQVGESRTSNVRTLVVRRYHRHRHRHRAHHHRLRAHDRRPHTNRLLSPKARLA